MRVSGRPGRFKPGWTRIEKRGGKGHRIRVEIMTSNIPRYR